MYSVSLYELCHSMDSRKNRSSDTCSEPPLSKVKALLFRTMVCFTKRKKTNKTQCKLTLTGMKERTSAGRHKGDS